MSACIVFETAEDFKNKIEKEFLPTLEALAQCKIVGISYPHEFICSLKLFSQFGMKTYSIYLDSNTKFAEFCLGDIGKHPAKDIIQE